MCLKYFSCCLREEHQKPAINISKLITLIFHGNSQYKWVSNEHFLLSLCGKFPRERLWCPFQYLSLLTHASSLNLFAALHDKCVLRPKRHFIWKAHLKPISNWSAFPSTQIFTRFFFCQFPSTIDHKKIEHTLKFDLNFNIVTHTKSLLNKLNVTYIRSCRAVRIDWLLNR